MKTLGEGLMGEDEIDRILSRDDEILASSGFTASVMDAVRREATAPPPIPFPWKRALPVLVLGVLMLGLILVGGVVAMVRLGQPMTPQLPVAMPSVTPSLLGGGVQSAIIWIVAALLVAFVSVKLSMRLASGRA
jgi:hypothetical protein